MFRKSLFLGLTLMLAAVLAYLVIEGRRQEKRRQEVPKTVEIVRDSPPSLTRVIAPDDLEIVESRMEISEAAEGKGSAPAGSLTAIHTFSIRHKGSTRYHSLALKIAYLNSDGSQIITRVVPVSEAPAPGETRSIAGVKSEGIPVGAVKCEARIAYADLESAPTSGH